MRMVCVSLLSLVGACASARVPSARDIILQYHGGPALACLASVATTDGFQQNPPSREYVSFWRQSASGDRFDEITVRVITEGPDFGSFVIRADSRVQTDTRMWRLASQGPDPSLLRLIDRMRATCDLSPAAARSRIAIGGALER